MRIAILMTNTDESPFADQHPKDAEKFTTLLRIARPDWDYLVYDVKAGVFPAGLDAFDGALITGSPASVHDDRPWIAPLVTLIRDIAAAGKPLYGACFGHQIIATALGGAVGYNPDGWVLGTVDTSTSAGPPIPAYAAHKEQVTRLPRGAKVADTTPGCPVAGFTIGTTIATTQYHPEMTPDFIAALLDEIAGEVGPEVTAKAKATLHKAPDQTVWANRIATFFDAAQN